MAFTHRAARPASAHANSWFGPPDGIDSTLIQQAFGSRSPAAPTAPAEQATAPHFFRIHRAFLSARVALALTLLALIGALHIAGTQVPSWMQIMSLGYASLTCLAWWWPSQRNVAPTQQASLSQKQALSSIGVDLAFFSALHQLTGSSVNSQALLVMPVLMAGVLMPRIMALGVAAAATLTLLSVAALQGAQGQLAQLLTQAGLTGIGLLAIAIISSELATRLSREERSARGSLELARQQAELNRLVLDEMAEGVMVIDRRGRVRSANPAARRLLSAHDVAVAPTQLRGVLAWQPLVEAVERAMRSPLQAEGGQEVRLRFDDHTQRELRLRVRFTQSPSTPHPAGPREEMCVMLLEDLRTVRARQRQDKLAAMGRMSAGIAHEIRNPLSAISQANALLAEDELQPGQQKLTQMISANVDRLKHIVDDILTVAPGVRPPAPLIDPVETVMAVCNEWRSTHRIAGGTDSLLDIDLSGCSHAPDTPTLKIRFEPEHLHRVLVNLLDNALRYNSGEPGAVMICLRWLPSVTREGLLMLSVGNDGAPIQPDTERSLFEPFFSTSSRGTGLGLYISRELCERHGASIDYRQHPPTVRHRNEFFVTMPVDSPANAPLHS
jgi:two-component system sensor histidine kinase PilS (NtrC family)